MTGYSFKPALLIGAHTYDLGEQDIVCRDKSGDEEWRTNWADITGAAFVEHTVRGAGMRRLDLFCGPDKPYRSISYTGPKGDPTGDPDSVEHLRLLVAVLKRLGEERADFQVSVGEYGKWRLTLFAIGASALVGAAGLGGLWFVAGVSGGRIADAAIPVLLLVLMGALLVWNNAPWRQVPHLSASVFATALDGLTGAKSDDV